MLCLLFFYAVKSIGDVLHLVLIACLKGISGHVWGSVACNRFTHTLRFATTDVKADSNR